MTEQDWTLPDLDSDELAHISKDLRALARPIDSVYVDPDNARLHPERNMAAVMASLKKYGQRFNIVVSATGVRKRAPAGLRRRRPSAGSGSPSAERTTTR